MTTTINVIADDHDETVRFAIRAGLIAPESQAADGASMAWRRGRAPLALIERSIRAGPPAGTTRRTTRLRRL